MRICLEGRERSSVYAQAPTETPFDKNNKKVVFFHLFLHLCSFSLIDRSPPHDNAQSFEHINTIFFAAFVKR